MCLILKMIICLVAAGGSKKEPDWPGATAANWGDLRGASGGAMDPRDMARANAMVDQRDSMRNVLDPHRSVKTRNTLLKNVMASSSTKSHTIYLFKHFN